MKALALLGFLVLASGCGGGVVYVDGRFSKEEEKAITDANEMWSNASEGALRFDLVFGQHVDVGDVTRTTLVRSSSRAVVPAYPEASGNVAWTQNHPTGAHSMLMMMDVLALHDNTFSRTVAHEMGHAHGLHHITEGALMTTGGSVTCVTRADLDAAGVAGKGCDE